MAQEFDYKNYPKHAAIGDYNEYQRRYALEPRHSDRVILDLIASAIGPRRQLDLRLLDIGCSTGNLLGHIRRRFPDLLLQGGDLAERSVEVCKSREDLVGIDFRALDIMSIDVPDRFDFVVTNAVTYLFDWSEFERAVAGIWESLVPGGTYIAFEWFHPFVHQDIQIFETTVFMPQGLRISARPFPKVSQVLQRVGFVDIQFMPFELPIEIPMPGHDQEVTTYTVKTADGRNLPFRGALFQPWCHLVASKAS